MDKSEGKARLVDLGFQGRVNTNGDGGSRILGLPIRVDDSSGRISSPDSQGRLLPERRFFVGVVSSSGIYRTASLIGIEGPFKGYAVDVPRRQAVGLFIDSELTVRDQLRRILPKREIVSGLVPVGA